MALAPNMMLTNILTLYKYIIEYLSKL